MLRVLKDKYLSMIVDECVVAESSQITLFGSSFDLHGLLSVLPDWVVDTPLQNITNDQCIQLAESSLTHGWFSGYLDACPSALALLRDLYANNKQWEAYLGCVEAPYTFLESFLSVFDLIDKIRGVDSARADAIQYGHRRYTKSGESPLLNNLKKMRGFPLEFDLMAPSRNFLCRLPNVRVSVLKSKSPQLSRTRSGSGVGSPGTKAKDGARQRRGTAGKGALKSPRLKGTLTKVFHCLYMFDDAVVLAKSEKKAKKGDFVDVGCFYKGARIEDNGGHLVVYNSMDQPIFPLVSTGQAEDSLLIKRIFLQLIGSGSFMEAPLPSRDPAAPAAPIKGTAPSGGWVKPKAAPPRSPRGPPPLPPKFPRVRPPPVPDNQPSSIDQSAFHMHL